MIKYMISNSNVVRYIRGTTKQAKKNNYVPLTSDLIFVMNDHRVIVLIIMGDGEHTVSELYYRSTWYRRLTYSVIKLFRKTKQFLCKKKQV